MYAMDPQVVRAVGGGLGELEPRARAVAGDLEVLGLPVTGDGLGLGPELAPLLAVWADAVHALGTELGLLEERCALSASGVEAADERARHRFGGRATGLGGS